MINIGIGIGWAKALYSVANNVIANFKARVLSYPNSIFEAGPCLDATLEELNAIGLLDNASLVITPNAYTEGILYDVVPNTTLGDMTVVRATTATRVNSAGLIEVVPRNLVFYSEQFDNAAWTKANSTVTSNATTAPNGTLTADRIQITSATNARVFQSGTGASLTVGQPYTFSCWIKSISGTGKVGIRSGQNGVSAIWSFTNEWVRYTFTSNAAAINEEPQLCNNTLVTGADVAPDFYAWGFQIDNGSTATEYFPTTTRLNIPRIDYTNGSCPSILVEPQRTNLGLRSQELDSALIWFPVAATVSANNTTSPDGTVNADKIIATAVTSTHIILQQPAGSVIGTTSTVSIFAKASGLSNIQIVNNAGGLGFASYNLSTGTATLSSGVSATIQNYGNGWYRCIMTYTPTTLGNYNIQIRLADSSGNTTFLGNGVDGVSLWGFQIEAGAYPTSYIPTVASTVTRNADVISKTGISSLIGQTEGTVFVDVNLNSRVTQTYFAISSSATAVTDYIGISFRASTIVFEIVRAGALQATHSLSNSSTGRFKLGIGYKANDFVFYSNGSELSTDNSGTVPTCNDIVLFNSTYSQNQALNYNSVQLYKTRLTNAELQSLTTL